MIIFDYVLFYPSVEVGGAEILFARIADELANSGKRVLILDSERKIIHQNIINKSIIKVVTKPGESVHVKSKYIIAFSSHITKISEYIHKESSGKLLFWNVHPLNSIYIPPFFGENLFNFGINWLKFVNGVFFKEEDNIRKSILDSLIKNRAFVCMDNESSETLKKYYDGIYPNEYIPIPAPKQEIEINSNLPTPPKENINIFWYGRLCDFKCHGLIHLINKIANIKRKDYSINLSIIGDGPYRKTIQEVAKKNKLKAVFLGTLPNFDALKLIKNNADIVFAMGTAALESSSLGIPTILAPASFGKIKDDYLFDWLYNTNNYNLGTFSKNNSNDKGYSIEELIHELIFNFKEHSYASRKYVEENHKIDYILSLIEKHSAKSTMEYSDFVRISKYRKPVINRISRFLIKNLYRN